MKKHISLLFGLSLLTNVCIADDWTERYTPTRAEWLQHELERNIRVNQSFWEVRVAVNVIVFPKSNDVLIHIGAPNGLPELTDEACNGYKSTAKSIAKLTLERKSWSVNGKIQIKCV